MQLHPHGRANRCIISDIDKADVRRCSNLGVPRGRLVSGVLARLYGFNCMVQRGCGGRVFLFDRQHHLGGKITNISKTCNEALRRRLRRVEKKRKKKSDPLRVLGTDPACCFRMRCQIISAVAGRGQKARDANESEAGRCCGSGGAGRGRGRGMVNSREGRSLSRGEASGQSQGEGF